MKNFSYILLLVIILFSCASLKKRKELTEDNFDKWLITAQEYTSMGRYNKALNLLFETRKIFPDTEEISITYNIAFNYYMLKRFKEAKTYLNKVKNLFQNNTDEQFVYENRKFDVLADTLIEKINKRKEELKDPYHIKEQIDENKKIRPKKRKKRPKIIKKDNK